MSGRSKLQASISYIHEINTDPFTSVQKVQEAV